MYIMQKKKKVKYFVGINLISFEQLQRKKDLQGNPF